MRINYNNEKGFSLIEVIVSVAIISICTVSVMQLFKLNVQRENQSKNKLIAIYLAQEQMEIIRQQRDNAWYDANAHWADKVGIVNMNIIVNMNKLADVRKGYTVVGDTNLTYRNVYCKGTTSCTENIYVQSAKAIPSNYIDTGFDRWAEISFEVPNDPNNSDYFKVISKVQDSQGNITSLQTKFYKWQWN